MDDLSGIVDDLRKKYCGLSGEVCYNERRQWALREYCRKENRMNQVNYQKELEKILNTLQEKGEAAPDYRPPRLFLHSCCAPCSSYCLEYLCRYFLITVFYYNPNISFSEEYQKRVAEQKRLIAAYNKEEKDGPSTSWREIMNRSVFMRCRRGTRTVPKEESGVSAASICDCVRPRNWHRPADMTILPRP